MTTNEFKEYVKTRQALDTEEIHRFMDKMSNEARRITFRLNTAYHTPDEVRGLLSELFGYQVPSSFRVFPPFSGRILQWAKAYLLMPAVIFRTMVV